MLASRSGSLRAKVRDEPYTFVTRKQADNLLDIAWENSLNDFELGPLWQELEQKFGLKRYFPGGGIVVHYRYIDVVEALDRRERGEEIGPVLRKVVADYVPEPIEFEVDDDAEMTAAEIFEVIPIGRRKRQVAYINRLGAKTVGYNQESKPLFRFGEVRALWQERENEAYT